MTCRCPEPEVASRSGAAYCAKCGDGLPWAKGGRAAYERRAMAMPSPLTIKLRLLHKRAEQAFKAAKEHKDATWLAYMKQMQAEGFCPNCEKPLPECKCVAMATGGYVEPSVQYVVGQYMTDCVIPRSVADKIQKEAEKWKESHKGLPIVDIKIPMPPVKDPRPAPRPLPCHYCNATGRAIAAKGGGDGGICLICAGTRYIWVIN